MARQLSAQESLFSVAQMDKKLTDGEVERLIKSAIAVRERAYCRYSKFGVGAALLTEDGSTITGCNVENVSFGLTICAERSAICAAVAQGHTRYRAVAIVADQGDRGKFVGPCGACRQVLAEFGVDYEVYLSRLNGDYVKTTIGHLIPDAFTPDWVVFPTQ